MNLSGMTSQIVRNADKIGLLLGAVSPYGVAGITDTIVAAVSGNVHVPDIALMLPTFANGPQFRNGVMAIIAGYAIDEFAPGGFKKYGKSITDFGIGYAEGAFLVTLLYAATHANLGSDPTKPGYNPNWMQNITNAPTTQQAIASSYQY